jgi:hypothetical protein
MAEHKLAKALVFVEFDSLPRMLESSIQCCIRSAHVNIPFV